MGGAAAPSRPAMQARPESGAGPREGSPRLRLDDSEGGGGLQPRQSRMREQAQVRQARSRCLSAGKQSCMVECSSTQLNAALNARAHTAGGAGFFGLWAAQGTRGRGSGNEAVSDGGDGNMCGNRGERQLKLTWQAVWRLASGDDVT